MTECQYYTNSKHGIPYHDFSLAEKDMKKLWEDILLFINSSTAFLWGKGPETIRKCLDWISNSTNNYQVKAVEDICSVFSSRGNVNIASSAFGDYFNVHDSEPCTYHSQLGKFYF